jgi:hypothetical protein
MLTNATEYGKAEQMEAHGSIECSIETLEARHCCMVAPSLFHLVSVRRTQNYFRPPRPLDSPTIHTNMEDESELFKLLDLRAQVKATFDAAKRSMVEIDALIDETRKRLQKKRELKLPTSDASGAAVESTSEVRVFPHTLSTLTRTGRSRQAKSRRRPSSKGQAHAVKR